MTDLVATRHAERQIERRYLKRSRDNIYIACEEHDFTWSEDEITEFRSLWKKGISIRQMSIELQRHEEEIAILIIDQASKGYIKKRIGGLFGTRESEEDEQRAKASTQAKTVPVYS